MSGTQWTCIIVYTFTEVHQSAKNNPSQHYTWLDGAESDQFTM